MSSLPTSAYCHYEMRPFLQLSSCIHLPNPTRRPGLRVEARKERESVHPRHREVKPFIWAHTGSQIQGPWCSPGIHELQALLLDRCLCCLQRLFNGRNISAETRDLASLRLTCCSGMYLFVHGASSQQTVPFLQPAGCCAHVTVSMATDCDITNSRLCLKVDSKWPQQVKWAKQTSCFQAKV